MAYFDEQILAARKFIKDKKDQGTSLLEIQCAGVPGELLKDLPVRFGTDNAPFVILKEDTYVELGNPLQGSASLVLWTQQVEIVRDGLITLIGPDIQESSGQSLPFGQVVLIGDRVLDEKDFPRIERARDLSNLLEGYMIRHVPRRLWSRVSRDAALKGFSFEILGRALMANYRRQFPQLGAIEILFVTSSKSDVDTLHNISIDAQGKSLSIRKLTRTQEGTYECEELNCDICPDKPACDTIRDVIVIRKAGKITGIEIVRGEARSAQGQTGKDSQEVS